MSETAKKEKKVQEDVKPSESAKTHRKQPAKDKDKKNTPNEIGRKAQYAAYAVLDVTEKVIGGLLEGYQNLFVGGPKRKVSFGKEAGMKSFEKKDYQKAIDTLTEYIEDGNGEDAEAIFTIGQAYARIDSYKEAIEWIKKADALETDDPEILLELCDCLMAIEDYAAAIPYLKKLMEADPDDADTYYKLGTCYEKADKTDEAKQMYKKAIDANPRIAVYYQALGFVHENSGNHKDAIVCFKKAMDLDRNKKRE